MTFYIEREKLHELFTPIILGNEASYGLEK